MAGADSRNRSCANPTGCGLWRCAQNLARNGAGLSVLGDTARNCEAIAAFPGGDAAAARPDGVGLSRPVS